MRAQRCSRLPARIALASMLAGIALAGASIGAAAANEVTLGVQVGYQDVVKPGEWMPVTIVAKNGGAGIDGTPAGPESIRGQPALGGLPTYLSTSTLARGEAYHYRT